MLSKFTKQFILKQGPVFNGGTRIEFTLRFFIKKTSPKIIINERTPIESSCNNKRNPATAKLDQFDSLKPYGN